MAAFDLAQTFYLDSQAVQNADSAFVTGVDLYFYGKPTSGKTKSGIDNPGVTVYLCKTNEDGSPDLTLTHHTFSARVELSAISVSTTGVTATSFVFNQPVPLSTDKKYAFLVKFDGGDPDFKLWYNKSGQNVLDTTTLTQVTSGKVDGSLYTITNGNNLTPTLDADLTFKLKVAKFTETESTFRIYNRDYEMLRVTNVSGSFVGGEEVYRLSANASGTIVVNSSITAITGTGTSFNTLLSAGDKFVITDGTTGNTEVRTVATVTNATYMTVNVAPSFSNSSAGYYRTVVGTMFFSNEMTDHIVLQDSTANSTIYLGVGNTIFGVDSGASAVILNPGGIIDYSVNSVVPSFVVKTPSGTSYDANFSFSNSTYIHDASRTFDGTFGSRIYTSQYGFAIGSETNRVLSAATENSFKSTLVFKTTNPYVSPYVREENLDIFVERYEINNSTTNEYTGYGSARARYISQIVNLNDDQLAEDLKVYVRAFRPANTNIKVYARLAHSDDSEAFGLKDWTELRLTTPSTDYSNPANINDYRELEFTIPYYGTGTVSTDRFTANDTAVIEGTSGVSTSFPIGSLVKVYSPVFPANYFVDNVIDANNTTITVSNAPQISNSSLRGSGLKIEKISTPSSAYIDLQSQNITTYFNKSRALFRGFDSFAIKVVMLSEDGIKVPFVDDVRAVAVSA